MRLNADFPENDFIPFPNKQPEKVIKNPSPA